MFSSEDRSKMLICIYILIYRHIMYNDGQHHFELLINIIFIYICITKSCQRNGKRCNETDATGMNYYSQFERRQCLESAGRTRREKAKWCFFVSVWMFLKFAAIFTLSISQGVLTKTQPITWNTVTKYFY